ncbi:MAG: replication factor C small subunit [Candidatus Hodarchaeales archaeon]|jgi:replication factor C small subunit
MTIEEFILMLTEKYRPTTLDDVVGQEAIVSRLKAFLKAGEDLPHFLFAGPAGVGKTSSAIAFAKDVFKDNFRASYLELNASDERGINVVREKIKNYASLVPVPGTAFRLICLDEADNMTADAQQALRRTMERYRKTRFILICNYSSKIIEPVQSRCVVFRFSPLLNKQLTSRLKEVITKEELEVDEEALNELFQLSEGDMRKALNLLQAASVLSPKINVDTIMEVSSRARPRDVTDLINLALKDRDFSNARKKLREILYNHGISGKDLIKQLYSTTLKSDIPDKFQVPIIEMIGEVDFRLSEGGSDEIQIAALLAKMIELASK